MILVTCHPRSGSKYMAGLLGLGWEVLNERGIAAWQYGVPDLAPSRVSGATFADTPARDHEFEYVIHLVRHPLAVVASTYYTEGLAWRNEVGRKVGLAPLNEGDRLTHYGLDHAARCVAGWYRLIRQNYPRSAVVRIEDQPQIEKLDRNARPHKALTWEDLAPVDKTVRVDLGVIADTHYHR